MKKKPLRRVLGWTFGGLAALLVIAVIGFVVWASFPMRAETDRTAEVDADTSISIENGPEAIVLEPTGASNGRGLVFVPGARVEAAAYEWNLQPLVDAGFTVVITHPALNFAILEIRGLDTYTALAPEVDDWAVGGHSLGGVRACQYAADGGGGRCDAVRHGVSLPRCSGEVGALALDRARGARGKKKGAGIPPGARGCRAGLQARALFPDSSAAKMSRSLVSGTKSAPITTVTRAMTIGYQRPK